MRSLSRFITHNNAINGWTCKYYNTYNDIGNILCRYCGVCTRPSEIESVAVTQILRRQILMSNDRVSSFILIFNQEKQLVKDFDSVQLRERRKELVDLIDNAKARVAAIDELDREHRAKLNSKQKDWVVENDGSELVSNAISAVKERKKRISKIDKLASDLAKLGIDGDLKESMLSNVERKQTGSAVTSTSFRELINRPTRTELEDEVKLKNLPEVKPKFTNFSDLLKKKE